MQHIAHPFGPVFDERSRVLVLGTMPSPRSREEGFYYGHPQNRFWKVLAAVFDEPVPATNERKRDFSLRHHVALWDVLAACDIEGASDASIAGAQANDLSSVLDAAPIEAVFCTGAKAAELYARLCEPACGMTAVRLPSTSPANAAWKLDALVDEYRAIAAHEHPFRPPALDVCDVVSLEQAIAATGTPLAELMDRAGLALAHRVRRLAHDPAQRIAVLCGSGNNGGDGWVAADELARHGYDVTIVTAKEPGELRAQPARDAALAVSPSIPRTRTVPAADVIVDAILGTGFNGAEVKEPYASWIREANRQHELGALVVAADVPSGLSAQTGVAANPCIAADATVTMIVPKPGLDPALCGTVYIAPLAYIEPLLPPV